MKNSFASCSILLFAIVVNVHGEDAKLHRDRIERSLQALLDEVAGNSVAIPGVAMHVETKADLCWSGASGVISRGSNVPLTPHHPVRIASNTKTFVAAAILRLHEQGLVNPDSPITQYLPNDFVVVLKLGGYEPKQISVRHLLTHTSGIFSYTESKQFDEQCKADRGRRWTRVEQLQGAMDWGKAYGPPGEVFHYSDTGYILLGEILEHVTKQSMSAALRKLVRYDALGLESTWLETLEPEPPGLPERAHQYEGDFDTFSMHPSVDLYGGGGHVSSVKDLANFMQGLFSGRVFSSPKSLDMMLSTVPTKAANKEAGSIPSPSGKYLMGIEEIEVDGLRVYWHTGYWGTMAAYVPEMELAVATTVNQQIGRREVSYSMLRKVLKLLHSEERPK